MKNQNCPYLGMQEDPTTALDFPSEGNFCHRAEPTAPVNKVHQQHYCLTAGHYGCPVYREARPGAMPPALLPPAAEPQALAATVTNRLPGFLLPGVIIGVAVLGLLLWVVAPQVLGIRRGAIPNTGEVTPGGDTSFNLFSFGDTRDETWTPFAPQFGGETGEMIVPNCPQPAGWMPYITNPTDSLFRLSVVYGVPVEDLQRANCKDTTDTVILPGQVIYVPASAQGTLPSSIFVQEATAFPTFTPVRPGFIPQATNTSSSGGSDPISTPTKRPVTSTPRPTATRVTATATRWVTPTQATATPTRFVTPTKPTATLRPTNTSQPTITSTPQPTATRFPTRTPRPTRTRQPTSTPTPVTPTNTPVVPTDTPVPTDPPPTNTPRPTDPPPTDTPRPTDPPPTEPPPTEPPPTDTPRPTDPPPTEPPPTEPPPTEPPPTDPPPAVTEPVQPTAPDITEPPPEEATPTDPVQPGSTNLMVFELF